MVASVDSTTHGDPNMNARKTAVEAEPPFESAWVHLEAECAAAGVAIVDNEKARSYLQKHSDTIDVTARVCIAARQEFGQDASLTLSVYIDPEVDDRYLRIGVRLPRFGTEILDRFEAVTAPFDEELCDISGDLYVTTDFRLNQ
jgi:hypothetical protein